MEHSTSVFDVIVIGGGHAGVEAATMAARRGARTALITHDARTIGAMSCNPAIGGVGKGHIVREIDALGGVMAAAADAAAIHHRMLNASKGRAVWGPRVQADRQRYREAIQARIESQGKLRVLGGEVADIAVTKGRVTGVILHDGSTVPSRAVVLATGTFLGGRLFRGEERQRGGRAGERAATTLGNRLRASGLPLSRLKTGTPPRLDGRTIDWSAVEEQPSDDAGWTLSPLTGRRQLPQVACGVTRTTPVTHAIVRSSAERSPMLSGAIGAGGPRYCPSIEDKVVRFGDRDGHQVFLEPEGLSDQTVYPNGISTSLPTDVQIALVRSIPGLEGAVIRQPGYAVEYDYCDPRALDHRLASRALAGLFMAGQINGTTGYEEAAGQGVVAGANAAALALGLEPLLLDRASSYIGVMIDDLVLQGVTEPYRMLTARAEYRLSLRSDNADTRLGALAANLGCLSQERLDWLATREEARAGLSTAMMQPLASRTLVACDAPIVDDGITRTACEWLRFPAVEADHLGLACEDTLLLDEMVEDGRYAPYLDRQTAEIAKLRSKERVVIPTTTDYAAVPGLSLEMVERLNASGPPTLAAASRIQGITPAALSAVLLHVQRRAA